MKRIFIFDDDDYYYSSGKKHRRPNFYAIGKVIGWIIMFAIGYFAVIIIRLLLGI